jgi:hypothetical protein
MVAQRLGLADPPAVQNQQVGGQRPSLARQRPAQLTLDALWVVTVRNPKTIGNSKHMTVDG